MKSKYFFILILVFLAVLITPVFSSAAAERVQDPLGRKSAEEISMAKSEKEKNAKAKKKREAKKTNRLEMLEGQFGNLTPAEKRLVEELPYEVRLRLKDIPRDGRLDWLIDRVVERKKAMVKNFLMKNERFSKIWDKTPPEDRDQLIKKSLKFYINKQYPKPKANIKARPKQEGVQRKAFKKPMPMMEKRGKMKDRRMTKKQRMMHPQMLPHPPGQPMDAPPPMMPPKGMRERMNSGDNMGMPPFMNKEMHGQMMKFMMENPQMLREMIKNLPPEFKKMLRKMLDEDSKMKPDKMKKKAIKKNQKDEKKPAQKVKKPLKKKVNKKS